MKYISIDNGANYNTASDIIGEIMERELWDSIVQAMDDETRERVAAELPPCTEAEFLARYLELAEEDLVIG